MPKEIARVFVFRSDSDTTRTYQTLQYTDGSTSCECKGWTFKRKSTPDGERSCKHTRYVDTGMAETVCVRMVDYAPVVAQPRRIQPRMKQQVLQPKRSRVLYLDQL